MQKVVLVKGAEYEIPMHVDESVDGEAEVQPWVWTATSPDHYRPSGLNLESTRVARRPPWMRLRPCAMSFYLSPD